MRSPSTVTVRLQVSGQSSGHTLGLSTSMASPSMLARGARARAPRSVPPIVPVSSGPANDHFVLTSWDHSEAGMLIPLDDSAALYRQVFEHLRRSIDRK